MIGIVMDAGRSYGRYITFAPKGVKPVDAMAEVIIMSLGLEEKPISTFLQGYPNF